MGVVAQDIPVRPHLYLQFLFPLLKVIKIELLIHQMQTQPVGYAPFEECGEDN